MPLLAATSPRAWRAPTAIVLAIAIAFTASGLPVLAEETAQFAGTILDPDGRPAAGFQVVLKDAERGTEFTSAPSGPDGAYAVSVRIGGNYALARVLAPDGTALPVQSIPPVRVDSAGTNRLDVAFQRQAPTPRTREDEDDRGAAAKPWYKKPWGIVGIVLGVGAVAALAAGGGDDDPPVSPSSR
jgi:hypothetical protein